jgi:hypothetical protein
VHLQPFCLSRAFNVDSIIQHTRRRMTIHLTLPSTFDSCARLAPFKIQ